MSTSPPPVLQGMKERGWLLVALSEQAVVSLLLHSNERSLLVILLNLNPIGCQNNPVSWMAALVLLSGSWPSGTVVLAGRRVWHSIALSHVESVRTSCYCQEQHTTCITFHREPFEMSPLTKSIFSHQLKRMWHVFDLTRERISIEIQHR